MSSFWATICKTVRPMLSDRCLSVCLVLTVMLVHCGQTVEWIKMKLCTQVGLGPGHTALDRGPAPLPQKVRAPPQFLAHICCSQMAGWNKMPHGREVGLDPGHTVLDGNPAPSPPKGHSRQFSVHICCGQMAGQIKMPLGREVGIRATLC